MAAENLRVHHAYRADLPDEGPRVQVELVPGTVITADDLAKLGRCNTDLVAWINRDSPGTLEPTSDPADSAPVQHVPTHLLTGMSRLPTGRLP